MSLFTISGDAFQGHYNFERLFPDAAGSNSSPCIPTTLIETTIMAGPSEELLLSATGLMYNWRRFVRG